MIEELEEALLFHRIYSFHQTQKMIKLNLKLKEYIYIYICISTELYQHLILTSQNFNAANIPTQCQIINIQIQFAYPSLKNFPIPMIKFCLPMNSTFPSHLSVYSCSTRLGQYFLPSGFSMIPLTQSNQYKNSKCQTRFH